MNRAQKALTENIVLAIRSKTSGWNHNEMDRFNQALGEAMYMVRNSLGLTKGIMHDNHYSNIVMREIIDCVRIARTYHDLTSKEIIESLDVAHEALK